MCWDPARSPTARVLIGEFQLGYVVAFINLWLASALHLARSELPKALPTQPSRLQEWISWARDFRTLIFCDWCVQIFDIKS
jgi:hypothetical protein